jgi:primosomal protein N''
MENKGESELYAGVVVEAPLTKIFHYRVPPDLVGTIAPGDRVEAPFGRRTLRGVAVSLTRVPPIDPKLIKNILNASAEEERIPEDILELTKWVASYYQASWGMTLAAAVPAGVKHGRQERQRRRIRLAQSLEEVAAATAAARKKAPKQADCLAAILQLYSDDPGIELFTDSPELKPHISPPVVKALEAKGIIEIVKEDKPFANLFPEEEKKIVLHPEQQAAVNAVGAALDAGRFQSFLLHGATGSGKTEVYMRLIAKTLEMGKGALVLVPEVSLTPQTVSRFRKRFGNIAVLHYKLGEGERAEHWRRLTSGQVRLAVGARSAVFAPVKDLGLIVVDEEHEKSYKQDNDPRYNARDIALVRASLTNACAILGSATPSLESWQNAHIGKHTLISMPTRAGGARTPSVKVVDLRQEWADVKQPVLFSRELERELEQCLKRKEQAILFLNRRGFHTIIRCPACGDAVECDHCDIAMTHHRSQHLLRCGYCGSEKRVPDVCPTCGSATLKFGGVGTERIEDILAGIFPKARLLRMDSDSMAAKDSHAEALVSFSRGDYDILLGTQMVAKGLDFPNVTLVGVLMADGALGMSDFRAPERTFQLVTQVIGRAGRSDKAGKAVVQAFQPDHHAVRFAIAQDYQSFVDAEIPDRLRRGYPPFGRLARVVVSGKDSKQVIEKARQIGEACKRVSPEKARLLGPAACEVERVQGVFRWHMIFFAPEYKTLSNWLAAAGVKPGEEKNVRVIIDVDPASMQ